MGESGFNDPAAAPVLTTPDEQLSQWTTGHAPARLSHVYALRIARSPDPDLIVKLHVVGLDHAKRVRLEWARLD